MSEPSQSLWRSRKQESPCLPVQEQSAAVLALAERCYPGLPRKPADAAPAALPLHELRVQRGTESCSSSSRQDCDGAVFEAFLQSTSRSHSPPFPSPHPSTSTTTHDLLPCSFLSAQTMHTKVIPHPSFPSRFPLTEMLCDSFPACWNVLDRGIPGHFTEVSFTAEEALIHTCFYKPRESWKCCKICTDLERITPEFAVIIFPPLETAMIQKGTALQESPTPGELLLTFANAALTLLSSSLPLWYPQQENCCRTYCILDKSPFWLKSPFRINFYCSLIYTHLKAALLAHKHYAC